MMLTIALGLLSAALLAESPANGISAVAVTQSGDFARPLDATPDPDGAVFYFTAIGPNGPGVFRVSSSGGAATQVMAGAPFVSPTGISISSDGLSLYVADPLAYAGAGRIGRIFILPVSGGTPRSLRGADGLASRAIEIAAQGSQDTVFFTGRNAKGQPAIYRLPATGGESPTVVVEGAPLLDPDGIAVGRGGALFVTDRGVSPGNGSVCKIEGSTITKVVETMRAGDPAGIALSSDESTLYVSTLQPYRHRAQVLIVNLATLETDAATSVVGQNAGAGGLHRARNREVMSWAGIAGGSGGEGAVYRVPR